MHGLKTLVYVVTTRMSYLSLIKCVAEYQDGRKSDINYIFDTPFLLKDTPHKSRFIVNAILKRYPHFQIGYGSLRITLDEYNKNQSITGFVSLIDASNMIKIKVLKISDISFSDYCCLKKHINIEKFIIETKN